MAALQYCSAAECRTCELERAEIRGLKEEGRKEKERKEEKRSSWDGWHAQKEREDFNVPLRWMGNCINTSKLGYSSVGEREREERISQRRRFCATATKVSQIT